MIYKGWRERVRKDRDSKDSWWTVCWSAFRLTMPAVSATAAALLCGAVFFFTCISGGVYDAIVRPPFMGAATAANADVAGDRARARQTFWPNRIDKQHSLEGLVAGAFVMLGAVGFVFLAAPAVSGPGAAAKGARAGRGVGREARRQARRWAAARLGAGGLFVVVALNALVLFMKYKNPAYLRMGGFFA